MVSRRYEYDEGTPTGVSFLLFLLALVALCISGVYLQTSTLHEREIKISAYEETIANWTSFRPTFSRLSVNVTAYFGVAPVNTTDPGLDTDPPPPGVTVPLVLSEDPDPIHDEEVAAGDLPNYEPLKFDEGVAPPPWRTASRFPPPQDESPPEKEEEGPDSSNDNEEGEEEQQPPSEEPSEDVSSVDTEDDVEKNASGEEEGDGGGETDVDEDQVEEQEEGGGETVVGPIVPTAVEPETGMDVVGERRVSGKDGVAASRKGRRKGGGGGGRWRPTLGIHSGGCLRGCTIRALRVFR